MQPTDRRYGFLAWGVLGFTVAVILGGAVVRASGSGAGCGESWPRCEGSILPIGGSAETVIEFTHRLMTLSLGLAFVVLVIWTLRATTRAAPVRKALWWTVAFFAGEVVIGATLVLFGWVDDDASLGRVIVVPLHLINTFFLLAALTITAHLASGGSEPRFDRRQQVRLTVGALLVLLVVGASGGLNALADTIFPADSFVEGLREEFGPTAPFLVRLRVLHPAIAVAGGIATVLIVRHPSFDPEERAFGPVAIVLGVVVLQFLVGIVNVAMATPLEIQIVHLLVADIMWIALVVAALRVLGEPVGARQGTQASVAR